MNLRLETNSLCISCTTDSQLCFDVPPDTTTLCPPPLEEAVSIDLYQRCISPPPEEEQQDGGEEAEENPEGT